MEVSFERFKDNRGELVSLYKDVHNLPKFVEDRISKSKKGVVRGFHGDEYTDKLLFCLSGSFKLVTYNLYTSCKRVYFLDEKCDFGVYVPKGTLNAHEALEDCVLYYKWSKFYNGPENQISIYYNDETINPNWENATIVSERDRTALRYKDWLNAKLTNNSSKL